MPSPVKDPDFVRDIYTVSEWQDVNAALKSPDFLAGRKIKRSVLENVLVMINGKDHLERRQIESPVFNREALVHYESDMLRPILEAYAEQWRVEGRAELVDSTLMLLARVGALLGGLDDIDVDEKAHAIIDHADDFARAGSVEWSKLPEDEQQKVIDHSEASRDVFEERFVEPSRAKRVALVEAFRAGRKERSQLPRDVITEMLLHWRDDWKPELLSLELLMYLSGSVRTSMRAVCNSIQEMHDWVAKHPEDGPLMTDPDFIRKAVNETIRLHVVVPALLRITARDVKLPSGLEIPGGEYVAILYARANREHEYFGEDADEFDPHRGDRHLPGRDYGVSFAAGAHACIGRRLAVGAGNETDSANKGTVMTIVEELLRLGAEPDPCDPAEPDNDSFYDQYKRYPVRFTKR